MLKVFTGVFDSINSRVMTLVKQVNIKGLDDENLGRALETVDRLHGQWSALPVWPLNVGFFMNDPGDHHSARGGLPHAAVHRAIASLTYSLHQPTAAPDSQARSEISA